MLWVDKVPSNLELLALLNPASVRVDNVAVEPPLVVSPVVQGRLLKGGELVEHRRVKRARAAGLRRSGTQGGRAMAKVTREDVLGAMSHLSPLHNLFVLGWCRILRDGAMDEFLRLAYSLGIERSNSFTYYAINDVRPVFWLAWGDMLEPCDAKGRARSNMGSRNEIARVMGCSASKAARFEVVYEDVSRLLLELALDVSQSIRVGLRSVAA